MSARKVERDRYTMPGEPPTDEDLRHEVELSRAELGDTVAGLMYKADVKARMREVAQRRRAQLNEAWQSARRNPAVLAGGAVTVLLVVAVLLKVKR